MASPGPAEAPAPAWRHVLTAEHGPQRLSEQPAPRPLAPDAAPPSAVRLWVDASRRFQTMLGFGGAFTEAAAVTWQALDAQRREQVLVDSFDPQHGHGYTLCRVHMNSCDFSLGNYAHAAQPEDFELRSFSIDRDRQALLPFIQAAQRAAGRPLTLLASPWSPPAWMKDTGRMNGGGRLRPECRAAWAQCFVRFIQAYAAEGVPIWGVTVQNEPMATQTWDSCIYTAEEERDFVRDHLGPALHNAGLGHIKIIVWDHNRDEMIERTSVIYGDADAARYIWGCGFHWYGDHCFDHVQQVHDAWPDKQLLFTEGCQEGGPHHGEWAVGERYGQSIVNDLNHWTAGWIDWNLLLDETGGPNHVGNLCSAPLLADRASGAVTRQSAYDYLGHFARFIQPGAQRVLCAANREVLETTGFLNPDGSLAVVVMNRSASSQAFQLCAGTDRLPLEMPPHSIATLVRAGPGRGS